MSYIGENGAGYVCAGRDGKIYIRVLGEDQDEMPLNLLKTYKFGEEYQISRVAFENGIESFKYGNETRNTLWLNQENMFIVNEQQVKNIYDKLKGLTINGFEGTTIINPAWDVGDIIIIGGKPIIYKGEMTFNKRFLCNIQSKLSIKQKQETTIKKSSQKLINRRVQSQINEEEGKIKQLVEEQTETSKKISQHEQTINGMKDTVSSVETEVSTLKKSAIVNVDVEYALGTTTTVAPTEDWNTEAPEWKNGFYMWQRTVTTYANGEQETSDATCIAGAKGEDGKNGVSIEETTIEYQESDSGTQAPTGTWSNTVPNIAEGKYLWTRTKLTYTDGQESISYSVARAGINGISLYTWLKYADTPTTGMSDSPDGKTYMGLAYNKTTPVESKDYSDYTWSLIKGKDGVPGTPGENGKTTYTWVKYATSSSGANMSDSPDGMTYIGLAYNKTTATESKDANDYAWSLIKGEDGVGVENTEVKYQASNNGTTIPTKEWSLTIPTVEDGQYLWTRTTITYTDKTSSTSYNVSKMGANGEDGIGIKEIEEQYYLSTSDQTQEGGSWKSTQDVWTSGKYIWTRSKITWTDGNTTYTTPVLATGLNNANSTANTANANAQDAQDKANEAMEQVTTTTEKVAQIEIESDTIKQQVSENTTEIHNNYQDIVQKLDDVPSKSDVTSIQDKVETMQTSTDYAINITEEIQQNGVTKVKTETGYTFDDDGLTIKKTDAKTKSTLNEKGLDIKDATGSSEESLLYAGYNEETGETIVKSKNMTVEKYLTIGRYSRIEDYEQGTGIFWIGG